MTQLRHPHTGRWLAHDCQIDCEECCAGLCGVFFAQPDDKPEAGK